MPLYDSQLDWLVLSLSPTLAEAQETHLTTSVPNNHTVSVEITGNGEVEIDGISLSSSGSLNVLRHSTPTVRVKAKNQNSKITVFYNGQDVTQHFAGDTWTLPIIVSDCEIYVIFSSIHNGGDNSKNNIISELKTGDTGIGFYVGMISISLLFAIIIYKKRKIANL